MPGEKGPASVQMGRCPLHERLFLWSASASLWVPQGRGIKVDLLVSTNDNGLPSCAPFLACEVFDSYHSSAVERFSELCHVQSLPQPPQYKHPGQVFPGLDVSS